MTVIDIFQIISYNYTCKTNQNRHKFQTYKYLCQINGIHNMNDQEILDKIAELETRKAEIADKVTRAGTKQLTVKILINSIYG